MQINKIDLYETRQMVEALNQLPPEPTFLRNTFFRNTIKADTDTIDIDIRKGGRRVVPYVRPIQEGVVIDLGGYETRSYKLPYIKVKKISEAEKHMSRNFGEQVYTTETPIQKAAAALVDDLAELSGNLDAEEERQAAEAVFTGKVSIRNANNEMFHNLDFGLENKATIQFTAETDFNEVLKLGRDMRRKIIASSGISPTDIVVSTDVGDALIEIFNPANKVSYLSGIRVDRGQVDLQNLPNGVTYLGYFKELGCDMWIYDGTYIDLDNTVKPYAPSGKLAMLSRNARFDKYYGAIKNYFGFNAIERFPHSWIKDDGSARILQLESAPLLAPHQVDSMFVLTIGGLDQVTAAGLAKKTTEKKAA